MNAPRVESEIFFFRPANKNVVAKIRKNAIGIANAGTTLNSPKAIAAKIGKIIVSATIPKIENSIRKNEKMLILFPSRKVSKYFAFRLQK